MQHHGEEYYIAAKEVRPDSAHLPRLVGNPRAGEADDDIVDVLLEVRCMLRSKGGRKKNPAPAQPTLF